MKQNKLWILAAILTICGTNVFTSCTPDNGDNPVVPTDEVELQLQRMSLREKVGQLFYVRPECLDTTIHFNQSGGIDTSTDDIRAIKLQAVNATMKGVNEKYPEADTHFGYAQSLKTWDEMMDCEMVPFKAGIQWGTQLVMTAISPLLTSLALTFPLPCRQSSYRTSCAANWATRTSSSPTLWRWEPLPSNTPMPRLPWVQYRLVPTSCLAH